MTTPPATAIHRPLAALIAGLALLATLASAQVDFQRMRQMALQRYGEDTAVLVDHWREQIEDMRSLPDANQLAVANRFFNSRIRFESDQAIWGRADYWATPLEVLGRGRGDCEDFAIAKYTMLLLAGMEADKLRITYVKARLRTARGELDQAHMVLAYYPTATAEPVILDNIVPDIMPASRRTDLTPVFGFNSKGLWVGGAARPASTQPEAKLSRWSDLLRRAAREGMK